MGRALISAGLLLPFVNGTNGTDFFTSEFVYLASRPALQIYLVLPKLPCHQAVTVVQGTQVTGDINDVFESDDKYLKFQPGLVSPDPPILLEFETTLPTSDLTSLGFQLESHVNTVGVTRTVEMFNYNLGLYQQVDERTASFGNDSVVEITLTEQISDFIENGTGNIKARIGWRPTGPVLFYPWTTCIDQAVWTYVE